MKQFVDENNYPLFDGVFNLKPKPMIKSISSCHDCPFCNSDNEYGNSCKVSDLDDYALPSYNEEYIPDGCPLIHETITVNLVDKAVIGKHTFRSEKYLETQRKLDIITERYNILKQLIESDNVTKDYLKNYLINHSSK